MISSAVLTNEPGVDRPRTDLRAESPQVREALSALGRLLSAALIEPAANLASSAASRRVPTVPPALIFANWSAAASSDTAPS